VRRPCNTVRLRYARNNVKRERVFENTAQLRWIIEGMGRDEKVGSLQKCNDTQNKHERCIFFVINVSTDARCIRCNFTWLFSETFYTYQNLMNSDKFSLVNCFACIIYEKNDFTDLKKNLTRYRSENNLLN